MQCVFETGRKKKKKREQSRIALTSTPSLTELRHLLNSPFPTALPERKVTAEWIQEVQHFSSTSESIFYPLEKKKKKKSENGSRSLKMFVFVYGMGCLCACIYDDISQLSMTELHLSRGSIIFPRRQQILLRSKHLHAALLRQVCLILTHYSAGLWVSSRS